MKKILLLTLILLLAGCGAQSQTNETVVTSIAPTTFLAEGLYPNATITQIIPNGQDPHSYTVRPSDVQAMDRATTYIGIGAGLEPFSQDIETRFSDENKILLAELVGKEFETGHHDEEEHTEEHGHGNIDPHVWVSPRQMVAVLQQLQNVPQEFSNNVTRLQNRYAETLDTCTSRDLFVTHDAYSYLADDYGLTLHTLQGLSPHEELQPRDAAEFVRSVQMAGAQTIFHEEQLDRRLTDRLARQADVEVGVLNPGLRDSNYIQIMEENLDALSRGLNCQLSQ